MKKNIVHAIIASLIMNGICLLINLICALTSEFLPLAIEFSGGEVIEYVGFGIFMRTIYPLSIMGEASSYTTVGLDWMSLLVSFILIFIIAFMIKTIWRRYYENRKNQL